MFTVLGFRIPECRGPWRAFLDLESPRFANRASACPGVWEQSGWVESLGKYSRFFGLRGV